jgi:hypothetical protein
MTMHPPAKPSGKPPLKGGKPGVGSRTRFLTVKKFRMDRVGKMAMSLVALLVIAAVVWCIFYFIG